MKKPNGRFLLTWNENKHPEVQRFFNETDEGLYSHMVRKAIKYYMEHKGNQKDIPFKSFWRNNNKL